MTTARSAANRNPTVASARSRGGRHLRRNPPIRPPVPTPASRDDRAAPNVVFEVWGLWRLVLPSRDTGGFLRPNTTPAKGGNRQEVLWGLAFCSDSSELRQP